MAKGSGCLEARFRKIALWHKERVQHLKDMENIIPEEAVFILPVTAKQAVNIYIEEHQEALGNTSHETKWDNVLEICDCFKDKVGKDKLPITRNLVLRLLEGTYLLTPEPSPDSSPSRNRSRK